MRKSLAILFLTLSACTTFSDLDQGMKALIGQPSRNALALFGPPQSESTSRGDTLYRWTTASTVAMPVMSTTTATGTIGPHPVTATIEATNYASGTAFCTLHIRVTAENIIKNYGWSGDLEGCHYYASRIKSAQ